jgi:hypothetical protein
MFHLLLHRVPCYLYDIPTIQELLAPSLLSHHLGLRQSKTKMERSYEEIALRLFICYKPVYRTICKYLNTGDVKSSLWAANFISPRRNIIMECILQTLPQITCATLPALHIYYVYYNYARVCKNTRFQRNSLCRGPWIWSPSNNRPFCALDHYCF